MGVTIHLEDENASRIAAWIAYFLFTGGDLPDDAGVDFAPLLEQIESQVGVMSVLDPGNEIEDYRLETFRHDLHRAR